MSSHLFYVISVSLHVLAAIIWVGGLLFLVLAVMPALRKPEMQTLRAPVVRAVALAFRPVGWWCLVILLVTGVSNLHARGWLALMDESAFWRGTYGRLLAVKLVVVAVLLALSVTHDFWIGPRVARSALDAGSVHRAPWRRWATWMGRLTALLSMVAVLIGVMLVRGRPW